MKENRKFYNKIGKWKEREKYLGAEVVKSTLLCYTMLHYVTVFYILLCFYIFLIILYALLCYTMSHYAPHVPPMPTLCYLRGDPGQACFLRRPPVKHGKPRRPMVVVGAPGGSRGTWWQQGCLVVVGVPGGSRGCLRRARNGMAVARSGILMVVSGSPPQWKNSGVRG